MAIKGKVDSRLGKSEKMSNTNTKQSISVSGIGAVTGRGKQKK
ncbi:MAG: hypothetical protein WC254_03330 [Candidatus Woesearchaeota archaeon]|jgi:hypothetical protein